MDLLFAIDIDKEEIIVSESPKGTNRINFVERIKHQENKMLYQAVLTLTSISQSPDFDFTIFKAMDKVCQMLYNKHKGN
jgi:hypothetical protein|uniref:hypothetical protein n=1 Tax=Daejeonella sp. TaxID=2805397 RepID=UPI00404A50DA